jgi:outer membrane protein W
VSWEKFEAKLTHRRKAKGFIADTRRMDVSIPDYNRDQVVELLALWTHKESYTLLEAAELLGLLNNISKICPTLQTSYR